MRDGFKIFDSDTHLNPMAETLEPYFNGAMRERLPEWQSCKVPFRIGWAGEILQPPYRHRYQFKKRAGWRERLRILGEAGPREHIEPHFPKFMGSRFPTPGGSDDDAEARIRDMDEEGVDVQLMLPGLPPAIDDVEVEFEFIRAKQQSYRGIGARNQSMGAGAMGRRHLSSPGRRRSYRSPGPGADLGGGQRRRALCGASQFYLWVSGVPRSMGQPVHRPDRLAPVGRDESHERIFRRRDHGSVP
jgi:hypothetical protein